MKLLDITKDKAWQRQIREQKEKEWSTQFPYWANIDLNLKKSKVKQVNKDIAQKIILEYEWLGTMGQANLFYGLFFENVCGGVACYVVGNAGAGVSVHQLFNLKPQNLCYLIRGACVHWTPIGSASKLISKSLNLIKKVYPKIKIVIAYADEEAGEIGTVYQATNWIYYGKGSQNDRIQSPSGFLYSSVSKVIYDIRRRHRRKNINIPTYKQTYRKLLDEGWKIIKPNAKHRYCYILADEPEKTEIYNRIKHLIIPYPKRCVNSLNNKTVGCPPTVGGVSPTLTLQKV